MTQTTPEQRAEATRLVALRAGEPWWWEYEDAGKCLLKLVPALLADAEELAARETMDEARRARVKRSVPSARLHTLHYDDAGQVVSGAPDFEGE